MNILVAGVHGVGKTFLASRIPETLALVHTAASKLISEERDMSNWDADKKVHDVNGNQSALVAAVVRRNGSGERLLLDGHFVLLNSRGEFEHLDADVFKSLNLTGVVLLEADPRTIVARMRERDGRRVDVDNTIEFMAEERSQAQLVCKKLNLPLIILDAPSPKTFVEAIAGIVRETGS